MRRMLKCIPLAHGVILWESASGQHFGKANCMFLMTVILKCMYFLWVCVLGTVTGEFVCPRGYKGGWICLPLLI